MSSETPKPESSVPASGEESTASPFDDGVLDAAEKTRIRDLVSSAVSFLASRRLLPAVLMRVGPMSVLLPLVWGIGFLRSRRWAAGFGFLGVGLVSLVMAFWPEIQFESEEFADETKQAATAGEVPASDDHQDVSSFMRPKKADKKTAKASSSKAKLDEVKLDEPIRRGRETASTSGRAIRPASAVVTNRNAGGGVWLLGTIEEVEDAVAGRRTADNSPNPLSMQ